MSKITNFHSSFLICFYLYNKRFQGHCWLVCLRFLYGRHSDELALSIIAALTAKLSSKADYQRCLIAYMKLSLFCGNNIAVSKPCHFGTAAVSEHHHISSE